MKKKTSLIIMLIVGILLILYPIISSIISKKAEWDLIVSYQDKVSNMTSEEIEDKKQKAIEYNNQLNADEVLTSNYIDLLNVGEIIGYIVIPKINVNLPIYHGTSEAVLKKGVGHVENTSLPVGGETTHSVLSAHTGLASAKLFSDLDELVVGDTFYIQVLNEKLVYKVDEIYIVDPQKDNWENFIQIQDKKDLVTLVTCTPEGINSYRLLVRGSRTEEQITENIEKNNEIQMNSSNVNQETNQLISKLYEQLKNNIVNNKIHVTIILVFLILIIIAVRINKNNFKITSRKGKRYKSKRKNENKKDLSR